MTQTAHGIITGAMCTQTGDVVAVVRCKDCKYYENGVCANINFLAVQPDDYCSYAEKIEEAKDD